VVALVQVICTKVRDGNKRIVQLKEGDPTGRHVVIVDDLVQSGGTLIECQVRQLFLYSIPIIIYMIWSLTSPF
jgi:phosphoribosylpyrophosphate synthetase